MSPPARRQTRLGRLLDRPLPVWPGWLDRAAEWWAGRTPRTRLALVALVAVALVAAAEARVRSAEQRWGGDPVAVLVAERDLWVGDAAQGLRRRWLPPRAVPPGATHEVPDDAVLALALPEGAVLTRAHLDTRGPAAGLPTHLRAVPVDVEEGWGVVAGGWVDVWLLADARAESRLVARSRPVLEVRLGTRPTALVGLAEEEVGAVTGGLAGSRLLLAHAPPPAADG